MIHNNQMQKPALNEKDSMIINFYIAPTRCFENLCNIYLISIYFKLKIKSKLP